VSLPIILKHGSFNSFEIAADKRFKFDNGYGYIPIYINSKAITKKDSYITVKLKLYKKVLVAEENININKKLTPSMFNYVEKNIETLFSKPVEGLFKLTNTLAKRKIKKGMILQEDMIKKVPVIQRGSIVTAYKINGNVEITFKAKARNDASIGDKINLVANRRIYKGIVVNKNYIKIIE